MDVLRLRPGRRAASWAGGWPCRQIRWGARPAAPSANFPTGLVHHKLCRADALARTPHHRQTAWRWSRLAPALCWTWSELVAQKIPATEPRRGPCSARGSRRHQAGETGGLFHPAAPFMAFSIRRPRARARLGVVQSPASLRRLAAAPFHVVAPGTSGRPGAKSRAGPIGQLTGPRQICRATAQLAAAYDRSRVDGARHQPSRHGCRSRCGRPGRSASGRRCRARCGAGPCGSVWRSRVDLQRPLSALSSRSAGSSLCLAIWLAECYGAAQRAGVGDSCSSWRQACQSAWRHTSTQPASKPLSRRHLDAVGVGRERRYVSKISAGLLYTASDLPAR